MKRSILALIALALLSHTIIYALANPQETPTQLLIRFWGIYLIVAGIVFYLDQSKRNQS